MSINIRWLLSVKFSTNRVTEENKMDVPKMIGERVDLRLHDEYIRNCERLFVAVSLARRLSNGSRNGCWQFAPAHLSGRFPHITHRLNICGETEHLYLSSGHPADYALL